MSSSNDEQKYCNELNKNQFSTDNSKNTIMGIDMESIYSFNAILMIIYYILLLVFVYFIYSDVRNSSNKIKKTFFMTLNTKLV